MLDVSINYMFSLKVNFKVTKKVEMYLSIKQDTYNRHIIN